MPRTPALRAPAVAVVAGVVALLAAVPAPAAATPLVGALDAAAVAAVAADPTGSTAPGGDAFYVPPRRLPVTDGAIVRARPITLAPLPGGGAPRASRAVLLMYRSTDTAGRPVAITGTYFEPSVAWTGQGPRPLVSYAAGTQGQGDLCAPSKTFQTPFLVADGHVATGGEIAAVDAFLGAGVAVVVTDYLGLGTPDRVHTYSNRVDQAHAVLDAARAAKNLPGTTVAPASPVGISGYSQGGGASAAAAELAAGYAPDLDVVGSYAGAPPADLAAVTAAVEGTALTPALAWALNGFVQTYPRLGPVLDSVLSDTGRAALTSLASACLLDAATQYAFHSTTDWTKDGAPLGDEIARYPVAVAAQSAQKIGSIAPAAPVRVATGTLDDFVPHAQVKALASAWCALGVAVTYVPIVQSVPSFGTGLNHGTALAADEDAARQWLLDRLAGVPAASNCADVAALP